MKVNSTEKVMTTAMMHNTATCWLNGASAMVPSEITTISADKMKSVRIAPLILSRSRATKSTFGSLRA